MFTTSYFWKGFDAFYNDAHVEEYPEGLTLEQKEEWQAGWDEACDQYNESYFSWGF